MKVFVVSLVLLAVLCTFIGIHSYMMMNLSDDIGEKCSVVNELADAGKWEEVTKELDEIQKIWQKRRIWSALTIQTDAIEQIEIAFRQSKAYAELGEKSDFIGEFTMFKMLIDHIPHQEGFHIEEIL